jgi:hypothetical protein
LDYQPVTVLVDATAAATPDIHLGMYYQFHESLQFGSVVDVIGSIGSNDYKTSVIRSTSSYL